VQESSTQTPPPGTEPDGLVLRPLISTADYDEAVALQDDIWGAGFSDRVPASILRVAQKVGGVSAGAFDSRGRMIGFVFGLTGVRDGTLVHWSDMLAVREEARGMRLGERLKHYQRDIVRAMGVEKMFWTFDPLVARNAHFNLNRLGASIANLDQGLSRTSLVRAEVGSRLNALDQAAETRGAESVDLQSLLSDLRDVDYAEAVSRLNQQYTGLQAAQAAYTRIAQLSLFDYL